MNGVQDIAKTDNLLKIIDDGYYDNVLYSKTPPGQIHNVGEEEEWSYLFSLSKIRDRWLADGIVCLLNLESAIG